VLASSNLLRASQHHPARESRDKNAPMARIYISSTYMDLVQHRDAVTRVLRQMQHEVVGMEDYAASYDRPSRQVRT
jgi:hypothetical protein